MRDVPADQLSKERLQNAILTQGLCPKPVRRGFPWLWITSTAAMAATVLALITIMRMPSPSTATPVAMNEDPILNSSDNRYLDHDLDFGNFRSTSDESARSEEAVKKLSTAISSADAEPVAKSLDTKRLALLPKEHNIRTVKSRAYIAEYSRGHSRPTVVVPLQNIEANANTDVNSGDAKKGTETLVLIQSDKDSDTGASNAIEVHQTEDVIVSS
jgi:hypothetical protein